MAINLTNYQQIIQECKAVQATLVAVSKIKPVQDIGALYEAGQRDFGENYVQELVEKQGLLPTDIRWHYIGHLQTNKVKFLVPFVHLIHGVDSIKLLKEISKQAVKINRPVDCLLQVFIAQEETKFGMDATDLDELVQAIQQDPGAFKGVQVRGMMGMASNTDDQNQIRKEFRQLVQWAATYLPQIKQTDKKPLLSFGMSGDYKIALEEGSNLIRVGSLLFGARN
jgi:hypothetical protein